MKTPETQSQTFLQSDCEENDSFWSQFNPFQPQNQKIVDQQASYSEESILQHQRTQPIEPQGKHYLINMQGRVVPIVNKDDLKETLLKIMDVCAHYFQEKLDSFTLYLCRTYPQGMGVQIAEQLWEHMLEENGAKFLSLQMIQTALLQIQPPKIKQKKKKWGEVFSCTGY